MSRAIRSSWRLLAVVAAVALLLAACGSSGGNKTTSGGATVAIAYVGPKTGDNANLGLNILGGVKLAVDQAQKAGVKITLKEFDTQGDPAQATTLKDSFVNDTQIIGLVGPAFSGETKAVLPALQDAGLVMVSASATNAKLPTIVPNETVFHRVIPDDDVQGKGLADYITKKLPAHSAFYIDDNSEYGKGLAEGTQKLLEQAGVATKGSPDHLDPKAQDFSATVNKAKAAAADMIFYGGYYAEAGRLKKQLTDAGVRSTFLSGDGSLDPGFIAASGAAGGEGAQITCPCNLATADAAGKLGDFYRAYKTFNGKDPGTYSTEGFDSANILINGIKAGNTTRAKLLNYVNTFRTQTYDGVSKKIQFEDTGNVKATGVYVFQVKSGKIALLGSTEQLLG